MINIPIWEIPGIIAVILFFISLKMKRNAIWGNFLIGVIISIIYETIILVQGNDFDLETPKDIVVICILYGALYEAIRRSEKERG